MRKAARLYRSEATPAFDAQYYHLYLEVNPGRQYVKGSTRIVGQVKGQPIAVLTLDFSDALQVDSVYTSNTQLSSISLLLITGVRRRVALEALPLTRMPREIR